MVCHFFGYCIGLGILVSARLSGNRHAPRRRRSSQGSPAGSAGQRSARRDPFGRAHRRASHSSAADRRALFGRGQGRQDTNWEENRQWSPRRPRTSFLSAYSTGRARRAPVEAEFVFGVERTGLPAESMLETTFISPAAATPR